MQEIKLMLIWQQIASNFILLCRFQNYNIHDIETPPFNLDTIIGESGQSFATKGLQKIMLFGHARVHVHSGQLGLAAPKN